MIGLGDWCYLAISNSIYSFLSTNCLLLLNKFYVHPLLWKCGSDCVVALGVSAFQSWLHIIARKSPGNQPCNLYQFSLLIQIIWWLYILSIYYCWKTCIQLCMPLNKIILFQLSSWELLRWITYFIQLLPWWSTICIGTTILCAYIWRHGSAVYVGMVVVVCTP